MTKCEIVDLDGGTQVMKNVLNLETGDTCDVVNRSIATPFWEACMDMCEKYCRVCVVGTPGIGKSVSIVIPIRMLLLMGKTVVYHLRTKREDGWMYEFTPTSNRIGGGMSYKCNVFPESQGMSSVPSLRSQNTYYIVDPGKSVDSCDPNTQYQELKVIIVASPDEKHWGGSQFEKSRGSVEGFLMYYPLWTLEELIQAKPYIKDDMTEDEIRLQFARFGGVPRHVFSNKEASIKKHLDRQDDAVRSMSEDEARLVFTNSMDAVGFLANNIPKSVLIGIAATDDPKFLKRKIVPVSARTSFLIAKQSAALLWERKEDFIDGYKIFEAYVRYLLTLPNKSTKFLCRPSVNKVPATQPEIKAQEMYFELGGCSSERLSNDMYHLAQQNTDILYFSPNKSEGAADMVYSKHENSTLAYYLFRATLGQEHTLNVTHLVDICSQLQTTNVTVFNLVQPKNYIEFVTIPTDPMEELAAQHGVDLKIWTACVPNPTRLFWNNKKWQADWDPVGGIENVTIWKDGS